MKKVDHPASKRFKTAQKLIDPNQVYSIDEAIELVKKTSTVKFDPSIELHARLSINPKKSDQQIRSFASLPHGSGKKVKIAVCASNADKQKEAKEAGADIVGEQDLIGDIKAGKIDFDVLVATPDTMKLLAPVAKTLGPKGLMPNPKDGTVTQQIKEVVTDLKKGKINFKNDDGGIIHVIIGKASYSSEQLKENYQSLIDSLNKNKPTSIKANFIKSISISSSMGPGIKVTI